MELLDLELLDDDDPFEIDDQAAHLFKHPCLGLADIRGVWSSDPRFYPAKPPAHWLMVAEISGTVLMVPLAPPRSGNTGMNRLLRSRPAPRPPLPGGPMTDETNQNMTPEQERAFYADPDNQTPQGPPTRRRPRLSDPVPVRLPPDVLEQVRQRARADDRSVSSWVRRAVEHELNNRSA